jgi:hypothetical protein
MPHLPRECYVKITHQQCVDVIAICRIASIEDNCLETDVCSASSGMDALDHYEVL